MRSKLLWLYSFLVMILVTFTPKVVFARMGSSGGHSGGGGHSSGGIGGGGGYSFNSSGHSDGSSYSNSNSSTNIFIFLVIIAFCCVSPSTTSEFILLFGFLFFCYSLILMPLVVYTIIHC